VTTLAVVLADESKKSGPIGLAVILDLCVVCYFLFKSMSRHMRKVREDFPGRSDASSTTPPPGAPAAAPPPPAAPPGAPDEGAPPG